MGHTHNVHDVVKENSTDSLEKLEASYKSSSSKSSSTKLNVVLYLVCFFLPLIAGSLFLYNGQQKDISSIYGVPKEKLRFFREYGHTFNLIFIGDSRTFCGIHPDIMDGYLGTNSVNMAAFAHWFPTQLPYYQDMVKNIKPGTTVVWTIGHQNFTNSGKVQSRYPIKLKNLPTYLLWGYPIEELADNLIHFNPFTQIVAKRQEMHQSIYGYFDKPVASFFPPALSVQANEASKAKLASELKLKQIRESKEKQLTEFYKKDRNVYGVDFPDETGDTIHSVALLRSQGSYCRVELDHPYFRAKQKENHDRFAGKKIDYEFHAMPQYMSNFKAILKLFKDNHIKLIVNDIQEAPNQYADKKQQQSYTDYMTNVVKPIVTSYGFPFIRVDQSDFTDEKYFDYNHFNSEGGAVYDARLAQQLKPFLQGAK